MRPAPAPASRKAARVSATFDEIGQARTALLRVGLRSVDAREELGAHLRGDLDAVSRALRHLAAIQRDLEVVRKIVRGLDEENQPWESL
jgi:hypothetical protein